MQGVVGVVQSWVTALVPVSVPPYMVHSRFAAGSSWPAAVASEAIGKVVRGVVAISAARRPWFLSAVVWVKFQVASES